MFISSKKKFQCAIKKKVPPYNDLWNHANHKNKAVLQNLRKIIWWARKIPIEVDTKAVVELCLVRPAQCVFSADVTPPALGNVKWSGEKQAAWRFYVFSIATVIDNWTNVFRLHIMIWFFRLREHLVLIMSRYGKY